MKAIASILFYMCWIFLKVNSQNVPTTLTAPLTNPPTNPPTKSPTNSPKQNFQIENVVVSFQNIGTETEFFLISKMKPEIDVNNAWLAVGFNSNPAMVIIIRFEKFLFLIIILHKLEWRSCSYLQNKQWCWKS